MRMPYTIGKKVKIVMLIFGIICSINQKGEAATNYWTLLEGKNLPTEGREELIPEKYAIYALDQSALSSFLSGLDNDPVHGMLFDLPVPGGTNRIFKVWQTSVMEAKLQQQFTHIRTFTAFAVDNPAVTAKIDYTDHGFHVMVLDGYNTFFIDPCSDLVGGYYKAYYKRDYLRNQDQRMTCGVDQEVLRDGFGAGPEYLDGGLPKLAMKQNGGVRKTYRLALSCTGEYALAVGGTLPTAASVLSAMVTTINRVNGIYERELSITFKLIANNDLLVYLNPNDDPFTANNSGSQLLGQNQKNTTDVIGSANYDLGHIFSTGGGGIALLGCVCKSNKAMGVTGSLNPVGDPYDVDYVCHEIGHQFGATHSFNRCTQENENTAFEPGGGSTIMGYAGICGPINNLQVHSDAYFHTASLDAISDYVLNGGTCGMSAVGIQPLSLPSIAQTYNIPFLTNFELIAPEATAPEGGSLLYCWEQWNLGDFKVNENKADSFIAGPSFRSFFYDTSRIRIFPKIDSIVKNVNPVKGERLPAVARKLFFKANVRTVIDGYGAFNLSDDQLTLNVVNTGRPFRIITPNTSADTLLRAKQREIAWDVVGTTLAPISTPNVDIYLSIDGGFTYPYLLATQVPNSGLATVMIPDITATRARIKVKGSGNVFFDISDSDLVIADSLAGLSIADVFLENNTLVYPNPASGQLNMESPLNRKLHLILYNSVGQEMWQGSLNGQLTLPVTTYTRGIYYLRISDQQNGGKTIKRIALQ